MSIVNEDLPWRAEDYLPVYNPYETNKYYKLTDLPNLEYQIEQLSVRARKTIKLLV
jgi:hypothetical protein